MNRVLLWIVVALILIMAGVLYVSYRPSAHLNVAPDARKQIEKARER